MTDEPEVVEPEVVEDYPIYYDALNGLLSQVQLNEQTKEVILKNYRARPQEFEQNAMRMLNYLTALGVRDNIARYLSSRFWSITQNIDLDMFQSMMNPTQPNPYAMGGMGYPPTANTPSQQYPVPPPQDDPDMKMMRMMMMMKMMNQPSQAQTDPMQQMMQMMMLTGGRMGISQEPVYGANGQPIQDSAGNQVMRFTMNPAMQQMPMQQGPDPSLELFKEIIRGQNEQKRASDDRYYKTLEKQREIEGEIAEKESRALRRRLAMVEQERSSDRLIEDVEKLRKLGLFTGGASSPQSLEAIKLQTDLDRWKYERETDLVRWQQKQDMDARKWYKEKELEDERERRTAERLGVLGDSLKDTLKTVVTPILSSMSSGAATGLGGQGQQQMPQEAPDFSQYDDQSLLQQYQEVDAIGGKAQQARAMLKAEMEKRMQERGHEISAQPIPEAYKEKPKEPTIDLGGLADLQFSVGKAAREFDDEDEDEAYEHSEELIDSIGDASEDDYETLY